MGQNQPLLWLILLLDINILLLENNIDRDGVITGLLEFTVI